MVLCWCGGIIPLPCDCVQAWISILRRALNFSGTSLRGESSGRIAPVLPQADVQGVGGDAEGIRRALRCVVSTMEGAAHGEGALQIFKGFPGLDAFHGEVPEFAWLFPVRLHPGR